MKTLKQLAEYLDDNARNETDNEAAAALRRLSDLYKVAYDMVWARSHESSKAAYLEMIDLIKGKANE